MRGTAAPPCLDSTRSSSSDLTSCSHTNAAPDAGDGVLRACFLHRYEPDQVPRVCGLHHTLSASRAPRRRSSVVLPSLHRDQYDAAMSNLWTEVGDRVFVRRYAFFDQDIVAVLSGDAALIVDTRSTPQQAREILDD